jgi:hypothetical protein
MKICDGAVLLCLGDRSTRPMRVLKRDTISATRARAQGAKMGWDVRRGNRSSREQGNELPDPPLRGALSAAISSTVTWCILLRKRYLTRSFLFSPMHGSWSGGHQHGHHCLATARDRSKRLGIEKGGRRKCRWRTWTHPESEYVELVRERCQR